MSETRRTLDGLVDEREKRILEFALGLLCANLDEHAAWIFGDGQPVVTEQEVDDLAWDLGIPIR